MSKTFNIVDLRSLMFLWKMEGIDCLMFEGFGWLLKERNTEELELILTYEKSSGQHKNEELGFPLFNPSLYISLSWAGLDINSFWVVLTWLMDQICTQEYVWVGRNQISMDWSFPLETDPNNQRYPIHLNRPTRWPVKHRPNGFRPIRSDDLDWLSNSLSSPNKEIYGSK